MPGPTLDRIMRLGRHRAIDPVWTAQRVSEVGRRLTAACDLFVFVGPQSEPRDQEALVNRVGVEIAEPVNHLPVHGVLVWDVLGHQVRKGLNRLRFN